MMLMSGVSQLGTQRVEMLLLAVVPVGHCTQQLELGCAVWGLSLFTSSVAGAMTAG